MVARPVTLRGFTAPGVVPAWKDAPLVLHRTEPDFVQATLDDLAQGPDSRALADRVVPLSFPTRTWKLYQPVHRVYHLVVMEAVCDPIGGVPLDPQRIDSAGMVLRRAAPDSRTPAPLPLRGIGSTIRSPFMAEAPRAGASTPPSPFTAEGLRARGSTPPSPSRGEGLGGREDLFHLEPTIWQGWMRSGDRPRGWMALPSAGGPAPEPDPDPEYRRQGLASGHPLLDALLRARGGQPLAEEVASLYVAPPEVCARAGKTILYGLVPLATADISGPPNGPTSPPERQPLDDDVLRRYLSPLLQAGGRRFLASARGNLADSIESDSLRGLRDLLGQVRSELDPFAPTPASRALLEELNSIRLTFSPHEEDIGLDLFGLDVVGPGTARGNAQVAARPLGDWLREAVKVLPDVSLSPPEVTIPDYWPEISEVQEARLVARVRGVLQERLDGLLPGERRFDRPGERYRLRAFIRVRGQGDCPAKTHWSDYSPVFTIAPWYESGGAPPTPVILPDVFDRDFLRQIKPDVALQMPESLFNVIRGNRPQDLLAGGRSRDDLSIGLDWLCSLSIPIVTICALIMMLIVANLLNIIFHWLPYILTCIPIPRISRSSSP